MDLPQGLRACPTPEATIWPSIPNTAISLHKIGEKLHKAGLEIHKPGKQLKRSGLEVHKPGEKLAKQGNTCSDQRKRTLNEERDFQTGEIGDQHRATSAQAEENCAQDEAIGAHDGEVDPHLEAKGDQHREIDSQNGEIHAQAGEKSDQMEDRFPQGVVTRYK